MSFLHLSLVLWTLPLALIPILLHLLTLQRLRTVELSTYRFLFDSYVQQRRRTQFLEALLAFLRTLFILGLIAFIGRPVVSGWDKLFRGGAGGRDVYLLVDCSASMGAVAEGRSALQRAQETAKEVVARLAPDDKLTLVRVTSRPEEVFSRVSLNVSEQQEKIDGLKVSPTRANYFATLVGLFGSEGRPPINPLVYIFTDCQSSGWTEVKNQGLERTLPEKTPFVIVNVGAVEAGVNLAVVGDAPPARQRAIVGLPVQLQARAVNPSAAPLEATVNFVVNDKVVRTFPMAMKPEKPEVVRFTWEPTDAGVQRCRFEVAGKGVTDPFPDDDRFEFAMTVVPKLPVVIVDGFPAPPGSFDDEALYLQIALTAGAADAPPADPKKPGPAPTREQLKSLDVRTIPESALTQEVIRDAAAVILANCGQLNGNQCEWLRSYVAAGGGLIVFPGDRVNPATYNTALFPMPAPLKTNLTGIQLAPAAEGDPENADTFEAWRNIDFDHPVLAVFAEKDAQHFRDVRFKKRWPLVPPPVQPPATVPPGTKPPPPPKPENARVLASFIDGKPALVEGRLGEGRMLLAAFPANAKWTNFPSRCAHEFVPLVFQMVKHVQRRADIDLPTVVPADGTAEFSVTSAWAPVTGSVTSPGPPPVTLELAFDRSAERWTAGYDRTGERGFYKVAVAGPRPDQRRDDLTFAVNLAREESDPQRAGEADFKEKILPTAEVTYFNATAEEVTKSGPVGSQTEYWQLIFLLFAVMLGEFMLATTGGRRKTDDDASTDRVRSYNLGRMVSRMTGGK